MWRRVSSQLRSLAPWRSAVSPLHPRSIVSETMRNDVISSSSPIQMTSRLFSSETATHLSQKKVEDVMPIATGFEWEELEAEFQGKKRFDMDAPIGPFGTKEAAAIVKSFYNKRIVGCPGGEGAEDEHDVVWFFLEKDKPHECPVCSQYFKLEVVGPGGPPDGHGEDDGAVSENYIYTNDK